MNKLFRERMLTITMIIITIITMMMIIIMSRKIVFVQFFVASEAKGTTLGTLGVDLPHWPPLLIKAVITVCHSLIRAVLTPSLPSQGAM
mmetsp:Transcript_4619/g.9006  ORF Transcript_4619/g.9006 Transcript_4619/m.9006 type:complete len:89 (-) Transcript_4619:1182-1448(-)